MIKENVITGFITKENIFPYTLKFTVLLGISIAAPFFHFQAVTGTIVNATLIIAAVILGKKEAIAIGIFPSIISIITGLLIPAVIPLVPFIILGNIILILTFSFLKKNNYWKGIIWGSVSKFLFLYLAGFAVAKIFESSVLAKIAMSMFSWQQLLTALSGGIVAYAALRVIKKA